LQTQFWQNQARSQVLKFRGAKYIFREKDFVFICLNQIFLSITKFVGHKIDLGVASPVSAGLGRTVARKSSIGDLHVRAGGLDILKIYF